MATIVEKVARPEIHQTQCFIGGKWIPSASGKTFDTLHPATEEVIAQIAEGDAADIDLAVDAARDQFDGGEWSRMSARERGTLMLKFADMLEENAEELAALETLDNGKPISDSRAADIPLVIQCIRYYAGWADKIQGDTIPIDGDFFCYTRREPVGVVGQIIPLELPRIDGGLEMGTGAGDRLHGRDEARRTNAANLFAYGATRPKGRHPRRGDQRGAWLRPHRRCGAGEASGRRQDCVHRRTRDRQNHSTCRD